MPLKHTNNFVSGRRRDDDGSGPKDQNFVTTPHALKLLSVEYLCDLILNVTIKPIKAQLIIIFFLQSLCNFKFLVSHYHPESEFS